MKGCNAWSYHPYKPLLFDAGDIYICRIAPDAGKIRFEWLQENGKTYRVYYRLKDENSFLYAGETRENFWELTGLLDQTDYAFYVESEGKRSRIRLARTGKAVGTVVNYLHPEDEVYSFSGRYLCSPSMVRHPDGFLLASMDLFAGNHPQNLTLIYRSDDDGKSWHYVSELMPCFWGKMFIHRGELYMLSCSTEYGDLLIGKSTDGGRTFSAPVTLLRGSNGKNGNDGVHKNPQNIFIYKGRIYNTLEWGAWANKDFCHAAMVMSCDENADLMDPENWHFTEPVKFDRFAPELEDMPQCTMTIEGTLALSPDGRLFDIMRFGKYGKALAYEVNTEDPDAPMRYSHLIDFPANLSKFMIKYDPVSNRYYSVATRLYSEKLPGARNLLSLLYSADLEHWEVAADLMDHRHESPDEVGFQYVDFEFEDRDILFLCRTAMNRAHNYHDANYSTFHRIVDFRALGAGKTEDTENVRFMNPEGKGKRILFAGNSMTLHGVKPDIGWNNEWGMAASQMENDYVHRLMKAVIKEVPDPAFCICQVADWERNYKDGKALYGRYANARSFNADIIIMRFTENCPADGFDGEAFKEQTMELLSYLNPSGTAKIIMTTGFWRHPADPFTEELAKEMNLPLVVLGDLGDRDEMKATGLFEHQGVAAHPGDLGMKEMADRIFAVLKDCLR